MILEFPYYFMNVLPWANETFVEKAEDGQSNKHEVGTSLKLQSM
jgi:hypothetical protein